eukprot:5952440-Ditylum_brightwellii.AAC.1
MVSDTTRAAQNEANHFDDTSQADCAMHGCKLLLKDSMGIKDNHAADPITSIRFISMPGAQGVAYTQENRAVGCLCGIIEFFGTPERRQNLKGHIAANNYKVYMPKLAGKTRVSSCHTIIQQMIFGFPVLSTFFNKVATGLQHRVFNNMTGDQWDLLEDMEAILHPISEFAMGWSQTASC